MVEWMRNVTLNPWQKEVGHHHLDKPRLQLRVKGPKYEATLVAMLSVAIIKNFPRTLSPM